MFSNTLSQSQSLKRKPTPAAGPLFVFDFDEAISSKYIQNAIFDAGLEGSAEEEQWEVARNIDGEIIEQH